MGAVSPVTARLVPLGEVDDALLSRWRELAGRAVEPNPFVDPDFVVPVADALGARARVALAVVEQRGRLQFALPVVRRRTYRRMPLPAVTTWLHDYGCLGTPLVDADAPAQAWRRALDLFDSVAPVAALGLLGTDGPVHQALSEALERDARRSVTLGPRLRPVVRRRAEPTYLQGLSGDRRKSLRRRRRQLGEELGGELRTVDHAGTVGLDAAVDAFLAMEAQGWKGRDGGALACRAGHGDFFRAMCHRFAARDQLRFFSLEVGGTPVAYECVLLAGDTMFLFKTAYDERLRRFGPGVMLITDVLSEFHDDGRHRTLDSCTGLGESLTPQLFPDRQTLAELLLLPAGSFGGAAAWLTPRVAAGYRRLRDRRAATAPS